MTINCDNIGQTNRASDYLYMHMQTILLAALDSIGLIVDGGKNIKPGISLFLGFGGRENNNKCV